MVSGKISYVDINRILPRVNIKWWAWHLRAGGLLICGKIHHDENDINRIIAQIILIMRHDNIAKINWNYQCNALEIFSIINDQNEATITESLFI